MPDFILMIHYYQLLEEVQLTERQEMFQGRVLIKGSVTGEAVVTQQGFNPLASYKKAFMVPLKNVFSTDQDNDDIFGHQLNGKILCFPQVIGSTSAGFVIMTIAHLNLQPLAMLFANSIDSLGASGIILSDIWLNKPIITIDQIGHGFLNRIVTGARLTIEENGNIFLLP